MPRETSQIEHAVRVRRQFTSVRNHCHAARNAARQRDEAKTKAERLQQEQREHKDVLGSHTSETTTAFLLALSPLAVLAIDLVLLWPVLEFLTNPILSSGPATVLILALVSAFILVLEASLAVLRGRAVLTALESGDATILQLWRVLSFLFAAVMLSGVVATFFISDYDFPPLVSAGILLFLGCLSLVGHMFMLYGGPQILDAISNLRFQWRIKRTEQGISDAEALRQREMRAAGAEFETVSHDLNAFNRRFPNDRLVVGPFDTATQQVLQEHFGYPVIQQPGQSGEPGAAAIFPQAPTSSPDQGGAAAPAAEPAAASNGESEYLRSILAYRVRSDESAVRPENETNN